MAGSIAHDPTMFRKVHLAGPPQGEGVKMENYIFWLAKKANCLLAMRRHKELQNLLGKGQEESKTSKPKREFGSNSPTSPKLPLSKKNKNGVAASDVGYG